MPGGMISVPSSFRAMPRWWNDVEGRAWLDRLPVRVERQCAVWGLDLDGEPLHGSNALVVPVRRGQEAAVLRLGPPGDDVAGEAAALTHWNGRAVVRLLDVDPAAGASLLERLDHTRSLEDLPVREGAVVLGGLARQLAIPAPEGVPSTREIARRAAASFPREWGDLGGPTSGAQLEAVIAAAAWLGDRETGPASVNGDLHFGQILGGRGGAWTVVDPVLLRGDAEYDLGRVLWSRLDELAREEDVRDVFDAFVDAAGVPTDRARAWVLVRSMSYLLWGLPRGLTEDPPRCRRLLQIFA